MKAAALILAASAAAWPVTPAWAAPMLVAVDPRVELMCILNRLADPDGEYHKAYATPYLTEVDAHFAPFANDPAVLLVRRMRAKSGIGFDAPVALAVQLDRDFALRHPASPLPPGLDVRWKDVDLDEYAAQMRAFAARSGFNAFFAAHQGYYDAVAARYREPLERQRVVDWFDDFFGAQPKSTYTVVPGLLTGPNNFGPSMERSDGTTERYQILSLQDLDRDALPRPKRATLALLVHEMAHSYINPVFDQHERELAPSGERILPLVASAMRSQAYPKWQIVADESGVRAVTILFMRDRFGAAAMKEQLREELKHSFVWAGELAQLFDRYRHARDRWPTLERFMPEVVRFFDKHAAAYAHGLPRSPFLGPLNAALEAPKRIVGPDGGGPLGRYLWAIQGRIGQNDGGNANRVFYGGPASNPALAGILAASRWSVAEDGISVAGRHFAGAGLVLIACRPDPEDRTRAVVLYAAAQDNDLIGINSMFHGPTDWVVGRRIGGGHFAPIASGNFARNDDDTWRLDAEDVPGGN